MASSSFGKKLKRMFKKSKSSKKTIKGREDAAADEMYFSCSESFDDAGEEAKGINRRFSFGNNKTKELANVQPDESKGLKELHNIVVTSEQKEMLKKVYETKSGLLEGRWIVQNKESISQPSFISTNVIDGEVSVKFDN